jgi:hypothetical protein
MVNKVALEDHAPFTDQESFPVPVVKLLAEYDISESWELDAGAIFKTKDGKYLGVTVSGCS